MSEKMTQVWNLRAQVAESQMDEWGERRIEAQHNGLEVAAQVAGEYEARARRDYFDAMAHINKKRKDDNEREA